MNRIKGIDVSYHQGVINWKKVKESGIGYAIIRAGYGRTDVDKQFHNNVKGCIENDIPFGVYWFIYGVNEAESIVNAELCHKTIAPCKDKIKLRVAADLEYDTDNNAKKRGVTLTKDIRTKMVIAFCERMKSYGYDVAVYANPDYLNNKFNNLSQYPLWLAYYTSNENNTKKYNHFMWQYSSEGSVPGISGNVDMNYLYEEIDKEETEKEPVKESENMVIKQEVKAYSKAKDGKKYLATNFQVKEFACSDKSDTIFISPSLVEVLQMIRNHFGKPVNINSGFRTQRYNDSLPNSGKYSQHLYGKAVDIRVTGVKPKKVAEYVETLIPNTGGIGIYSNFVHIDVREAKSRWNG